MAATKSSTAFIRWSLCQYRIIASTSWRSHLAYHTISPPRVASSWNPGVSSLGHDTSRGYMTRSKLELMGNDQSEQVQQPPPRFDFFTWGKWLLGSIISLLLPFWKSKWDSLMRIEENAEQIVKEVEVVAEVVEKVATSADVALTEVVNELPDNSKLKEAAQVLEHVSKVTAEDAKILDNVIHQVGDVKQDLEELETMLEPIVEKIIPTNHHPTQ